MSRIGPTLALSLLSIALGACGGSPATSTVSSWLGSARHLRVVGLLNGEKIDVDLKGAAAAQTATLWCEREYQAPLMTNGMPVYAQGHQTETRIKTPLTINGQARILDLEIKMHNLQADAPGTVFDVVPRDDSNPPCTAGSPCQPGVAWFQAVWYAAADNSILYKQAALSGSITAGEFTGSVDSTGMFIAEDTGDVGAFATGQWSPTEHVSVSFDANCTSNDIDNG